MSDDLVKRLRGGLAIGEEAADRIEELEDKLANVKLELNAAVKLLAAAGDGLRLMVRVEIAEDKLAKAVDVGNKMAHSIEGNYYLPSIAKEWRTTLAELKGQDDA